jgi:glutamate synthase domain-containing protein 1
MIDPKTIIDARRRMTASHPKFERHEEDAAEGGCGVVGLACEIPVAGRHLFRSLEQMRNRGNGKGGGVAMVGLDPSQFNTDRETLDSTFLYAVAYLNIDVREGVEALIEEAFHPNSLTSVDESAVGERIHHDQLVTN